MDKGEFSVCSILSKDYQEEEMEILLNEAPLIILSVINHFQLNCISLINTPMKDMEGSQFLINMERYLSRNMIFLIDRSSVDAAPKSRILHVLFIKNQSDVIISKKHLKMVMMPAVWLLFPDSDTLVENILTHIHIPFDCLFLVAQKTDNLVVLLSEMYRVSATFPLQSSYFGNWTSREGLIGPTVGFYQRRNNLQNVVLRGAIKEGPALKISAQADGQIVEIGGFIGVIWNLLKDKMNFTTSYYRAAENAFGVKMANGSWNGMLGMVQKKDIDVISTDILMDPLRLKVVNFMNPLFEVRTYMLIRNSNNQHMDWKNFLKPFSPILWATIMGSILALSVSLYIVVNAENLYFVDEIHFTFYRSLSSIYYSFCLQGQGFPSRFQSSRIVLVMSYLTAVVLIVGYSGFLISYLTFRTNKLPFTSFNGFLEDGTYRLGVLSNSIHYAYFKETTDQTMHQLYQHYIYPNKESLPKSFLEGLHRICNEKNYAFMAPVFITNSFLKDLNCKVVAVPDAVIPATATIAIDKESPFQGLFSYYIQKMRRSGLLKKLRESYLFERIVTVESSLQPADMEQVAPIFSILEIGILVSVVILLIEIIFKHFKRCRRCCKEHSRTKRLRKFYHLGRIQYD